MYNRKGTRRNGKECQRAQKGCKGHCVLQKEARENTDTLANTQYKCSL